MNEKTVSMQAGGIAAFTLVQVLLEKLVERGVLEKGDVSDVLDRSVHLNERVLPHVTGNQNRDAVYLLEQLRVSIENGWTSHS